ncbi:phosphonate transport system ATP-binding protein [Alkalispirillum mobile]|uniref:Phosphonate transport system ATP-binding protein n=1 Tax=Alkalispirillum mobile TaxID=85925 RepID=A0A498CFN8_9GAMM|nr:phosphonate ABC transporter ATP-binding protein [Alkalispirillum mobile]RLK51111.1 phosphonate transport system ATP-binding protein [Alkalispirillum mobile]
MNPIEVRGLQKHFGKVHVLRGLDFNVPAGEGAILLGANGCGKSTLMRCLIGLTRPDAGQIRMVETDVRQAGRREMKQMRRRVGMVFQRFNLVGNCSVLQNVLYGALGRHRLGILRVAQPLAPAEERDRAIHCLDRVGLADRAGQRADTLSGGQQQRVAIARMLMQGPEVVLADEPIASLDPRAGREVMDLLWEVIREEGMTVICTLHQLDVALAYGDRVIGMKAGRVELDGPASGFSADELETLYHGEVRVDGQPGEPGGSGTPQREPIAVAS